MKKLNVKYLMIMSLGLLCSEATAGFEQFDGPNGAMNVYERAGLGPGDYLFFSLWGLPDLQSLTTDNRTFELLPNTNVYGDGTDPFWSDLNGDGNKYMEANTLFEIGSITNGEAGAMFSFEVTDFDLDSRYYLEGFVKVLDPSSDFSTFLGDLVHITSNGTYNLEIEMNPRSVKGMLLQAGWALRGINANPATNWGSATVTATALAADTRDFTSPAPTNMSFEVLPFAVSDHTVSMTAVEASDISGVEYNFISISGGGNDSGWQDSRTYVDSGLSPNTLYEYAVVARDKSVNTNETNPSVTAAVTTDPLDDTAPSPSKMEFASPPGVSPISISMVAVEATDSSPVEYYFECTSTNAPDSGWQTERSYYVSGLMPGSNYTYTVVARDLGSQTNLNTAADPVVLTTLGSEQWLVNPLTNYLGSTEEDDIRFELDLDNLSSGSDSSLAVISLDASGVKFGEGVDFNGRNILRTAGGNYNEFSFEVYATYQFDGAWDQSAYIGMGQGVVDASVDGNFGVPELALSGVNGIVGEFKTILAAGAPNCNMLKIIDGEAVTNQLTNPVSTNETFRALLEYDAGTELVTISVDTNFTGGAFVADRVIGTFDSSLTDTNSMWEGRAVRVYVGGGEGTIVTDLMVRADPSTVVVDDLSIASESGAGYTLTWEGLAGQIYDVEYRNNLQFGDWLVDDSTGCTNIFITETGMISATSTVDGVTTFYQVINK